MFYIIRNTMFKKKRVQYLKHEVERKEKKTKFIQKKQKHDFDLIVYERTESQREKKKNK